MQSFARSTICTKCFLKFCQLLAYFIVIPDGKKLFRKKSVFDNHSSKNISLFFSSTPSTSASTSPRALRETSNSQATNRPSNCRITRSARRSMQQDPSTSPVTADAPAEFAVFSPTSKKGKCKGIPRDDQYYWQYFQIFFFLLIFFFYRKLRK